VGCGRHAGRAWRGWLGLGCVALVAPSAQAARVTALSPQGEVGQVQQVQVRFSDAVVTMGDPRLPAPFVLACNGSTPLGNSGWQDDRNWAYYLREPIAAGSRCTLKPNPAFKPLDGALQGPTEFAFSTGAPVVLSAQPYPGASIEEDQHFLLRLNGAPDLASVRKNAWCEVEGLGERVPVRVIEGAEREQTVKALRRDTGPGGALVLLACQRPLPADVGVRLVWGAGIAAAGQPQLVSRRAQRYGWKVRPRFLAEFTCERENATAPCLPLRPVTLRFNAPVPRELALAARLQPMSANAGANGGPALAPKVDAEELGPTLSEVRFAAPLPENTRFTITLPPKLVDDSGRVLANAGSFPLAVATGGLPPLAKFAGAPFGIVEAGGSGKSGDSDNPALLPLTLRHVQADLAGASTGGRVAVLRLDAGTPDETLLRWMARLQRDHNEQTKTREVPMLANEPGVQRAELPQLKTTTPRATEVIGIPLPQRGYHVVEVQSRILGQALLASRAPMYARTGALVTNLGVHLKAGRSSSLVWVTSLDRGRPVAGARVAVNDCRGKPLWSGSTDATGIARIERGFEDDPDDEKCATPDGLFVTARLAGDLGFVFSRWARGIEPWRFGLPVASGTTPDRRAHTVLDRNLLRTGDTVHMKHFVRDDTERGPALPAADTLPTEVVITHLGSDTQHRLPLTWPRGARAASSTWVVPKTAALGAYDVALVRGDTQLFSASLRVEAFRVPLLDARLAGPGGVLVAPTELAFNAQLNAMAGGPMAAAPVKLSALLRPTWPSFAGYDDYSFDASPPAPPARDDEEGSDGSQLVADKLQASTDKQGAAKLVVKGLPPITAPATLTAELSFADPNGEVQTVSQRLALWPAAVVVGLRVPDWAASKNRVGFNVVVLSTDGKPLKGRAVDVSGVLHKTLSTRKRIVGGFYAYDNQREDVALGALCSGTTDSQGQPGLRRGNQAGRRSGTGGPHQGRRRPQRRRRPHRVDGRRDTLVVCAGQRRPH
jgi:hypothetical protein